MHRRLKVYQIFTLQKIADVKQKKKRNPSSERILTKVIVEMDTKFKFNPLCKIHS